MMALPTVRGRPDVLGVSPGTTGLDLVQAAAADLLTGLPWLTGVNAVAEEAQGLHLG
jgi:hypothetical protein